MSTLHYIHDPLCGWCYGAAPLLRVARELLPVQAHGGGMMSGPARRAITPELRQFVIGHDRRIAQVTGQVFGEAYRDGLLRDSTAVLDSSPPITAILAAEAMAGAGLALLARIQTAHYVEGRRVADFPVLASLAAEVSLDAGAFEAAYLRLSGPATQAHIASSRALLTRVGGQGFPTFALETDGQFTTLDVGPYLGNPEAWRSHLRAMISAEPAEGSAPPPFCGVDGCAP